VALRSPLKAGLSWRFGDRHWAAVPDRLPRS